MPFRARIRVFFTLGSLNYRYSDSKILSVPYFLPGFLNSIIKLPDPIKEELWRTDTYPRRLLVEVAKQESHGMMLFLFNQIKNNKLNSGQVREITRRPKNGASGMEHNVLKEISGLADHLKKIDQQEVSLLADKLMKLKSLIEEVIHP
jgi:hypothetical protein